MCIRDRFDYVMANPPFNVDEVVVDKVSDDARFNTYGVPRNKSKSTKKKSDKKETVPNANYLWIGYFATALNEHGKAALVMANSASDASGSEYDIRKKMIEEGIISQMVTLPSNMLSLIHISFQLVLNIIQHWPSLTFAPEDSSVLPRHLQT